MGEKLAGEQPLFPGVPPLPRALAAFASRAGLPALRPPKPPPLPGASSECLGLPSPQLEEPSLGSTPRAAINVHSTPLPAADWTAQTLPGTPTCSFRTQEKAGIQVARNTGSASAELRMPKPRNASKNLLKPITMEHLIITEPGLRSLKDAAAASTRGAGKPCWLWAAGGNCRAEQGHPTPEAFLKLSYIA